MDEAALAAIRAAIQEAVQSAMQSIVLPAVGVAIKTALEEAQPVRRAKRRAQPSGTSEVAGGQVLDAVVQLESEGKEVTVAELAAFLFLRSEDIERALQKLFDEGRILVKSVLNKDGQQSNVYSSVKQEKTDE